MTARWPRVASRRLARERQRQNLIYICMEIEKGVCVRPWTRNEGYASPCRLLDMSVSGSLVIGLSRPWSRGDLKQTDMGQKEMDVVESKPPSRATESRFRFLLPCRGRGRFDRRNGRETNIQGGVQGVVVDLSRSQGYERMYTKGETIS